MPSSADTANEFLYRCCTEHSIPIFEYADTGIGCNENNSLNVALSETNEMTIGLDQVGCREATYNRRYCLDQGFLEIRHDVFRLKFKIKTLSCVC